MSHPPDRDARNGRLPAHVPDPAVETRESEQNPSQPAGRMREPIVATHTGPPFPAQQRGHAPAEPTIPFPGADGTPLPRRRARRLPDEQELRERAEGLATRRARVLAPGYRLRLSREPLEFVRGEGAYLYDARGRQYLDAEGSTSIIGHSHPLVRERVRGALDRVSVHTGHLDEQLISYAERLVHMFPAGLDRVLFACSGSEAVDLALRITRYHTRRRGVLCTAGASHGNTAAGASISPALGDRSAVSDAVVTVPAPDVLREPPAEMGRLFAQRVRDGIAELSRRGHAFAGIIMDPILLSDGLQADPPGFLLEAREAVREAGGLWIADEAHAGFGRIASYWWGYQRHELDPDLVVLGDGAANSVPVSAVLGRHEVFESFGQDIPYFSSYGGSTASIAAATAVLDVLKGDALRERARRAGRLLAEGLVRIAEAHEPIAQVRGAGMVLGLHIVRDQRGLEPAPGLADALVHAMRRRGVLLGTTGPAGNVVTIRPPLVCAEQDASLLLEAFEDALAELAGERAR